MKKKNEGFKLLLPYAKGQKRFFIITVIAIIVRVFLNFASPQVVRVTIDSIIGDKELGLPKILVDFINLIGGVEFIRQNLWVPALFIITFAVFNCIGFYIASVSSKKGAEGLVRNIRDSLYQHIQKLPYSWHTKNQTGDIIQRVTSDVDLIRRFISGHLPEMFRILMFIVIALFMMFSINVKLSFIALAFIPIIMTYTGVFYGIISRRFKETDEAEGELYSTTQENLTGVRVVRAFGREKYELDKFEEKNEKRASLWVELGKKQSIYWSVGDIFSGLQVMSIMIFGAIEAINGGMTLGEFVAFVSFNSMLVWPLRAFGRVLSELGKSKVSLGRLAEIINEEEEIDDENALTPDFEGKDIEFKNVTFKYGDNSNIIENLSFKIKGGETFAILGGTGSGKTTIMHLLNRLYDLEDGNGEITIGGINIKDIRLSHLRKNIGMVLQEPFLYSKTIKENMAITKEDIVMSEVEYAARTACVHEAIEGFVKGYETLVGERGVTLSGGQKQRVAIARMLMQNAPIMVFDDSLSAVDSETDAKIRAALKANRKAATTILISHRITTLMQADNIMVLDKGKIVDMGTHEELIQREGIYKDIYDVQMNMSDLEGDE